jgi:hypothetical protein
MNRFFDFSPNQLRFLAVLCAVCLVLGAFLFVKTYVNTADAAPPLEIFVGENDQQFTGIFILDPNTAPADSLELLPGIGRVLADRIVEYRQKKPFQREIDVTNVKGISAKVYERIKPYLKIRRW